MPCAQNSIDIAGGNTAISGVSGAADTKCWRLRVVTGPVSTIVQGKIVQEEINASEEKGSEKKETLKRESDLANKF